MVRLRRHRSIRNDRGAAAVEFALILPVFMLMLMASIDWGYFFFVDQVVTNAARDGARFASVQGPGYKPADVQNRITSYLKGNNLTKTPTTVGVTTAVVNGAQSVRVELVYPSGSITGFLPVGTLIPAAAWSTAVMRLE